MGQRLCEQITIAKFITDDFFEMIEIFVIPNGHDGILTKGRTQRRSYVRPSRKSFSMWLCAVIPPLSGFGRRTRGGSAGTAGRRSARRRRTAILVSRGPR